MRFFAQEDYYQRTVVLVRDVYGALPSSRTAANLIYVIGASFAGRPQCPTFAIRMYSTPYRVLMTIKLVAGQFFVILYYKVSLVAKKYFAAIFQYIACRKETDCWSLNAMCLLDIEKFCYLLYLIVYLYVCHVFILNKKSQFIKHLNFSLFRINTSHVTGRDFDLQ